MLRSIADQGINKMELITVFSFLTFTRKKIGFRNYWVLSLADQKNEILSPKCIKGGVSDLYNKMGSIIYFLPISSNKMCETPAEHILYCIEIGKK